MLSNGACRLMGHFVSWGISSQVASRLMGCVVSWACGLMGHVILGGMSSLGACRPMGHVVSWGMSSYGDRSSHGAYCLGPFSLGAYHLGGMSSDHPYKHPQS